ncbi:MAG TPA: hypothetical protein VJ652_20140 [Noviherbaspirillum sp.]|nr:hypothetical protein [Noviherbaspirillum sp.]
MQSEEEQQSLATESAPVGPQVDLAGAGYMPFIGGSTWSYSVQDTNDNEIGTADRSLALVSSDSSTEYLRLLTQGSSGSTYSNYEKKQDGLYFDFTGAASIPAKTAQQIGLVREFAFPTYAVGESRVVVRTGTWEEDLDGDGQVERFRLEYTQVYKGLEPLALPWDGSATVAKFTSSYRLMVTTSKAPQQTLGWVATQDEYFAKNVGSVKTIESMQNLAGEAIQPTTTLFIKSATVNGVSYAAPESSNPPPAPENFVRVDLPHNDLVYDAARNRYYASVPSTVIGKGNSIATVDPQTGEVTYSSPVGSEPNVLSLAPDGKYLYVGLGWAGQVIKLSLPNLTEVARINLGSDSFFGPYFAESIAVSPANSDVFAVSLMYKGVTPRHAGVALVNGTTIASKKTQVHTGSNLITFNSDGTVLYGFNNETTEYGLRQIAVADDGLTETKVVATNGVYGIKNFQYDNGKLYLGAQLYSASDLSLLGQFQQNGATCRVLTGSAKVACLPSVNDSQQVNVYDANTLVAQAAVPITLNQMYLKNMVAGPQGIIAISYGESYSSSSTLYLLKDQNF